MTTKTVVGVGLISVGWMGKVHSRAYQAIPVVYPELGITPRLVIAADTEPSRADYARDVLGYEEGTLDYHDVLAHPDVDVVSICAPNFLHAEIGIAAAKAGKAFWIEKPVGRGVEETRSVEAAADAAGVASSIGFNYRHAPAIEQIKTLIADGSLGRITNVRGTFFADYSSEPNGALSWRFNRALAGSGVLGDLMGHLVDLIHYLGGPIGSISALTSTIHTQRPIQQMGTGTHFDVIEGGELGDVENEDYAAMLFRFADSAVAAGAVGTLEASRVAVGPRASYNIEIYGTEGSVMWDFERMNEFQVAIGRTGDLRGNQPMKVMRTSPSVDVLYENEFLLAIDVEVDEHILVTNEQAQFVCVDHHVTRVFAVSVDDGGHVSECAQLARSALTECGAFFALECKLFSHVVAFRGVVPLVGVSTQTPEA
jgi:predicted dehydrogenase